MRASQSPTLPFSLTQHARLEGTSGSARTGLLPVIHKTAVTPRIAPLTRSVPLAMACTLRSPHGSAPRRSLRQANAIPSLGPALKIFRRLPIKGFRLCSYSASDRFNYFLIAAEYGPGGIFG